jgi:diaminopimelate dehydrogenase
MKKIKLAIVGNGKLGKACEEQINKRNEFELVGIFSRRVKEKQSELTTKDISIKSGELTGKAKTSTKKTIDNETLILPYSSLKNYTGKIDVVLFCGGSSNDASLQVPEIVNLGYSTVDSFDTHAEIKNKNYVNKILENQKKSVSIIGAGWDPGIMSIIRILNKAYMPSGVHNAFYGDGLSMGHTNAIKQIDGVLDAYQITSPREDAIRLTELGENVAADKCHKRICFVVAKKGKEKSIENEIRNLDNYFKNQLVEVNFISQTEFNQKFYNRVCGSIELKQDHKGKVISVDENAKINWQIEMKSNPTTTAKAMLAYALANKKLQEKGQAGVYSIDEVPVSLLVSESERLSLI